MNTSSDARPVASYPNAIISPFTGSIFGCAVKVSLFHAPLKSYGPMVSSVFGSIRWGSPSSFSVKSLPPWAMGDVFDTVRRFGRFGSFTESSSV